LEIAEYSNPPLASEHAVFWDVVEFLLKQLLVECREERREPVTKAALGYTAAALAKASGHANRGEQRSALESGLWRMQHLIPRDLRTAKTSRVPVGIASEYRELMVALKPALGRNRAARAREIAERLREGHPHLSQRKAEEAAKSSPSEAARIILGRKYAVAPIVIKHRVEEERKLARRLRKLAGQVRLPLKEHLDLSD
jgi:hypothetical protein